jgi:hypothetical protein
MRQLTDRLRAETTVAVDAITRALDLMRSGDGRVDVALKGVRDVVTETISPWTTRSEVSSASR